MLYPIIVIVLAGYLLGNLNGSVCISTMMEGEDVRTHGSGNAGLTNFFRNYGGWNTALVALVDGGKTVLACLLGGLILGVFAVTFAITRYVSLGSVLAAVSFSVGFAAFHHDNLVVMLGGVFLGLLAVWMHRSNIVRLIRGTESKVHLIHRDLNKQ